MTDYKNETKVEDKSELFWGGKNITVTARESFLSSRNSINFTLRNFNTGFFFLKFLNMFVIPFLQFGLVELLELECCNWNVATLISLVWRKWLFHQRSKTSVFRQPMCLWCHRLQLVPENPVCCALWGCPYKTSSFFLWHYQCWFLFIGKFHVSSPATSAGGWVDFFTACGGWVWTLVS